MKIPCLGEKVNTSSIRHEAIIYVGNNNSNNIGHPQRLCEHFKFKIYF